jgi:hypothetical protein
MKPEIFRALLASNAPFYNPTGYAGLYVAFRNNPPGETEAVAAKNNPDGETDQEARKNNPTQIIP